MRQLLLLRHAKSSWDDAGQPDRDRPINPRGQRSVATMRGAMRDLGLLPDIVLVSTSKRTLQTLDLLEPWDETPLVEQLESLYLASLPQLLAILRKVPETARSVMLIGHNPGMHELALALLDHPSETEPATEPQGLASGFPTTALAEFVIPGPWREIGPGGGRLVRFLTPRALEGTA